MGFKEFFLLLCFVQSILLAFSLFSLSENKLANRLLGLLSLVWGAMCYYRYTVFQDVDYILQHHFLLKFNNVLFLMFFVFPFLYVKYMSRKVSEFKKTDLLHFLPALFAFLALIPFFILPAHEKIRLMTSSPEPYLRTVHAFIDNFAILQGVVYVLLSLRYINKYHKQVKEDFSNIDHLTMYWLRNLIVLIFIIWFFGSLGDKLYASKLIRDYYFDFLFFFVGGSIYVISYYLFVKRELFVTKRFPSNSLSVTSDNTAGAEAELEEEKKNLLLEDSYCEEVIRKLVHAMEVDKMYLNQNLSLNDVSRAIGIPRHHISLVLNNKLNNTFFDYINRYRVEEVKRMIQSPGSEKLTLLGISFEAGFNSKATFNRSFKKYENVTPQQYRSRYTS